VTTIEKWPAWTFRVVRTRFTVNFEVENPMGGTVSMKLENMTPGKTVAHAWAVLRMQEPRLYEHATLSYMGFLPPGLTIQAGVMREQVRLTVVFEVIRNREIRYENQVVWNMWTSEDIWNRYFSIDKRLLPFECYEVQDELRNIGQELYGPRKKPEGKQLENKMKAQKEARKAHQILKRTGMIQDMLTWLVSETVAAQVEREMNDGGRVIIRRHEKVREKKKSLSKYIHAPKSTIALYDPDDDDSIEEESIGEEEEEGIVKPTGASVIPETERVKKVCDSMFQMPKKKIALKTPAEKCEEESKRRVDSANNAEQCPGK
jgi:hypothetical protein